MDFWIIGLLGKQDAAMLIHGDIIETLVLGNFSHFSKMLPPGCRFVADLLPL